MIEELIESGRYLEALEQLTDMSDEHVRYLRLVCLNALEEYPRAKQEGAIAKSLAEETYYEVLSMYLTSLKECEEYEEAVDLLVNELSMPYIPGQYESLFNAAYDEILLLKQEKNEQVYQKKTIFSAEEIETVLKNDHVNEDLLYMALDQLSQLNIRRLIPTIRSYLANPDKPPFAKSLVMEMMVEQEIDEEFTVVKFHRTYDFNPSYATTILAQLSYEGIGRQLVRVLEDENPSLMHQCLDFLEYYLYAIYPEDIYEEDYGLIAAAIHYYVATLQYIDLDEGDLEIDYNVAGDDVRDFLHTFKKIEN